MIAKNRVEADYRSPDLVYAKHRGKIHNLPDPIDVGICETVCTPTLA